MRCCPLALASNLCLPCTVLLAPARPPSAGAFRAAFHAQMSWEGQECCHFVCKFAKDPSTPKSMYFNDVEAHEVAALYAKSFSAALNANANAGGARASKHYPPISYVAAFIVEFVDKPGRPVCGCEQALPGTFRKYNNNVGAVCAIAPEDANELRARAVAASAAMASAPAGVLAPCPPPGSALLANWDPQGTAQAFSHYSFSQSNSQLLICDIQGVANRFTDPQIHTLSGKGFGLGNLGQTGIRAFLLRHTCTDICRACGLTPVRAKDLNEKVVIPNFNNLPLHLNVAAVASAGSGSTSAAAAQRRQASVDQSQSNRAFATASAAATAASSRPVAAAAASYSASATPSASRSPSSSPRGSGGREQQPVPSSSLRRSPPPQSSAAAAAARAPPPPPQPQQTKKPTLDDSDEALMASIMGE